MDAALKAALAADAHSNRNPLIIVILKTKTCNDASWQIATQAIFSDYSPEVPLTIRLKLYEEAFLTSIDPGKGWLEYFFPRGWSYPFSFREALIRDLYRLKTGERISEIPQKELLYKDPKAWLTWFNSENGFKPDAPAPQPASEPPISAAESVGEPQEAAPPPLASSGESPGQTAKIGKYRAGATVAIILAAIVGCFLAWQGLKR